MSLVESFKEKVMDATKSAVKASSDFLEVTKINLSINSDEDAIKGIMFDIGKEVYESYNAGKELDEVLSSKCQEIASIEKSIEEKKLRVTEIKNLKQCPECTSEVEDTAVYCSKCGKKLEE